MIKLGHFTEKNDVRFHQHSIVGKIVKLFESRNVNTAVMSIDDIIAGVNAKSEKDKRNVRTIVSMYSSIFNRVCRAHYKIQRFKYVTVPVRVKVAVK